MDKKAQMAVVGLAAMGAALARNAVSKGISCTGYNRNPERTHALLAEHGEPGLCGVFSPAELAASLEVPRKIVLMVKAGEAVDDVIGELLPHLESGDILLDGGNSYYGDTERRQKELAARGICLYGVGISGGEKGALLGSSMMPGGDKNIYPAIAPILERLAAKTPDGEICCRYMGPGGAGHYVKMVHNGIEYAEMQLLAECYELLSRAGIDPAPVFGTWSHNFLAGYLTEITANILNRPDQVTGGKLIDFIDDAVRQKGTGSWTMLEGSKLRVPLTAIADAVAFRRISEEKQTRKELEKIFRAGEPGIRPSVDPDELGSALYAARIIVYAQGFELLKRASSAYAWDLDLSAVAGVWQAGCIIRSKLLAIIRNEVACPVNLLAAQPVREALKTGTRLMRKTVSSAINCRSTAMVFASCLSYFDAMSSGKLPGNLIQAQRDFFGAHTFERTDGKSGERFHENWEEL